MICRLYILGIIGIVWVLIFHVKDSNYFSEDNVIAPVAVEEQTKGLGEENVEHSEHVTRQDGSSTSIPRA